LNKFLFELALSNFEISNLRRKKMFEGITFKGDGKAYHLEIDHINPNILTAGSPGRIEKLRNYLTQVELIEGKRKLTVVHGKYKGLPISGVSTGMGPASTAIVLPEVIELAKSPIVMLRLGTSGSLQPWVKLGDLVISTGVVRDELTTKAVVGLEYPAISSPELLPILIASAQQHHYTLGKNLWTGITHVKSDLYFCETPHFSPSKELMEAKLLAYKRMGVLASAMEFSVYCIHRDFYEGYKDRILVGNLLAIIAATPEVGAVDVSKVNKEEMEDKLIKIGLDSLLLANKIKIGDSKIDLTPSIRQMIKVPARSKLKDK
jgi:uridine phosphorylase